MTEGILSETDDRVEDAPRLDRSCRMSRRNASMNARTGAGPPLTLMPLWKAGGEAGMAS